MAEIPESWGLTTQERPDGKLDIMGKTDVGESYRVRTTDGPAVTDHDIAELHDADREAYSNPATAAKEYVSKITDFGNQRRQERENAFENDLIEPAGEVMFAALDRRGHSSPFTGSTRAYRRGWEIAFGKDN